MRTDTLEDFISRYNSANGTKYDLIKIKAEIENYQNVNSEMQTFKNKKFGTPEVKYDNGTGRVVSMIYKEIGL